MTQKPYPSQQEISVYLDFANTLADNARDVALKYYRRNIAAKVKADRTLVTEADLEIEKLACTMVDERFPEHGFMGEEFGVSRADRPLKWCVDPIDGTESFVYGLLTFGVLISLAYYGKPLLGILEMPAIGERWCGAHLLPTTWCEETCYTNSCERLEDAIVFATSIDMFSETERVDFDNVSLVAKIRRFGIDCYAYGLLASGFVDVVMESDMKAHDYMAHVPIVEGAGGVITDWHGNPLTLENDGYVLATAGEKLHEQCLQLIQAGHTLQIRA